ncbi:biotin transporter BioY [Luteococcus sp. OSA5]|uniref:biotin transporter BioY n=1 Tax=Luteococcus sp. OSA5 TaxID=3401630 RepID=UPI003B437BF1
MKRSNPMTDLALVSVFAALIAAVTVWMPGINVAGSSVPITLQTLAIGLAAMVLGPWRGMLATLLYIVVGLAGIPVFAGGSAGLGVLGRPSAGFIIAFPIYAFFCGLLAYAVLRRSLGSSKGIAGATLGLVLAGLLCSILITHPLGIAGMAYNGGIPLGKAFKFDMAYWPGDVIKTVLAAVISVAVHKAFPMLALGSAREAAPSSVAAHA